MSFIRKFVAVGCIVSLGSGCFLSSILDIYNEDVNPEIYDYGDRSLIFVGIVHFGQETYYENLEQAVIDWKADGYTVFYEEIGPDTTDQEVLDTYLLKWRKVTGDASRTRASYEELEEVFEGGIAQPEYSELGIDDDDVNADISFEQLVDKYEEVYGKVELDDCDRATPLTETYECGEALDNDLTPVILDYRNEYISRFVIDSDIDNVVLIYGQDHIPGIQELLKEEGELVLVE